MPSPTTTVRTRLLALVLACVLPLCAFGIVAGHHLVESHQDAMKAQVVERLRVASMAIDQHIAEAETVLEVLSASPALRNGDLERFHAQLSEASALRGIGVLLADPDGQVVLSSLQPFGTKPERRSFLEAQQRAIATGAAAVSDLVTGVNLRRPILSVELPVTLRGTTAYLLAMAIPAERLSEILVAQRLPDDWVIGVSDRRHVILARSRDPGRFVGTQVAPNALLRRSDAPEGSWTRSIDFEQRPVLSSFVRSAKTGWATYVAVPETALDRPIRGILGAMTAAGGLTLLVGGLLAFQLARGITGPLDWFTRTGAATRSSPPPPPPRSRVEEIDQALRLVVSRERQRDEATARLRSTRESAAVGIVEVDAAGRYVDVNEAMCRISGYARDELLAMTFRDLVHPDDQPRAVEAHRAQAAGRLDELAGEFRYLRKDGRTVWVAISGSAVRDAEGRFRYGVRIVQDVSARREAEERQRLLVAELNHRVKNTLATVRSLARQTLRGAPSLPAFSETFEARLRALSETHALLTQGNWDGASLHRLCEQELAPYGSGPDERWTLDGPAVQLSPRAALTMGMALHELATNAAKYGALSAAGGHVSVTWRRERRRTGDWLHLEWVERGGPPTAPPPARGFGTHLIERSVTHELGGSAQLDFAGPGLRCRIAFPLRRGDAGPDEADAGTA
ncbi:sensor histidine kinase [Arenibaculum pallidiluteum]|uniref:sensor histidine kinase n=1 Tax=Arenibaculum pallidiluteum TaxID=2812559 RepID=UPI001A96377D|nr:HWE histidine kinase domain-containing protein [Arenibaculum pallidiluteum]